MKLEFLELSPEERCLYIDRSFWEKATILHSEYHRPAEKRTVDRFSRHYADTASLAQHPTARAAINQQELRNRVVTWKSRFFGSSWANYEQAKPGSFRLVPPAERQPALRRDYEAMRDMYLTEPATFDDILATLSDLENRINQAAKG
ncbi:MAG: nucleotidyl transferase AbiEii/AbiGii toxin family protein [Pirellulales bacterium]